MTEPVTLSRPRRRGVLIAVLAGLVVVVAAAVAGLVVVRRGDSSSSSSSSASASAKPVVQLSLGNGTNGIRSLAVQVSEAGLDTGDTLDVRVLSFGGDGSKSLEGRTVAQAASRGSVRADVNVLNVSQDRVSVDVRTAGRTCTEFVSMSDPDDALPAMTCVSTPR